MKKISLTFLILALYIGAFAQNEFPTSNAIWNYKVWADDWFSGRKGEKNVYYTICGDTTVNSTDYNKLYTTFDTIFCGSNLGQFLGAFRQEGQKVYFLPCNYSFDYTNGWTSRFGEEFLLYDFGLSIGDTINLNCGFRYNFWDRYPHSFGGYQYRTFTVSNTEIVNGIKKIDFVHDSYFELESWYEGIGSITGLFQRGEQTLDGYFFGSNLNCFKHNGTVEYLNNSECEKCFCKGYINIKENTLDANIIKISPNPTNDILNIEIPENIDIKSINIYSMDGKLIEKNMNFEKVGKLNISKLNSGSYIVNIETKQGVFNKIIIKE
jgi:hypothetical protein